MYEIWPYSTASSMKIGWQLSCDYGHTVGDFSTGNSSVAAESELTQVHHSFLC
jgi:hypothetical protein